MIRQSILRSLVCFFAVAMGFVVHAQRDYYVKYGADVKVNHNAHYPIMVGVSNVRGEQQVLNNIASAPRWQA